MLRRSEVLLLVAVLSVLGIGGVCSEEPRGALEAELDALDATMHQAMIAGDFERILTFYADDAVVLPNNAPKIVGKAAMKASFEAQQKSGVTFGSFASTVERAWECGELVYSVGSYAMSATVPGTPRPVADKGKFFSVYRRSTSGNLQIVYDIWNTDVEYGK